MNINNIEAYNYELPKNFIAQNPAQPADTSKLLLCNISNKMKMENQIFNQFSDLLDKNTVIFFNNSKVIKSRIPLDNAEITNPKGEKRQIKDGEIFYLNNIDSNNFEALIKPGKKLKPGSKIILGNHELNITKITKDGRLINHNIKDIHKFLEEYGQMPLPPYIQYKKNKENPYQPVFAKNPGSTASPTASLHFTRELLAKLKNNGINFEYTTLHIGLGTFKIVNVENIKDYDIHTEQIEIDKNIFDKIAKIKLAGKTILSIGTTSTRTLETLPYLWYKINKDGIIVSKNQETINYRNKLSNNVYCKIVNTIVQNLQLTTDNLQLSTKLYITPGFKFKVIDELITNFHLPKSSLLMLVAAFMGYDNMIKTYQHAIKNNYRFFSFGDAMYIKK